TSTWSSAMTTRITGAAEAFMRSVSSSPSRLSRFEGTQFSGSAASSRPVRNDDEADGDARAFPGRRVELEAAAGQRFGTLAHVAETHAGHVICRDAPAIIGDREADPIRLAAERDLDPRRAGVAEHVRERLVHDAQQRFLLW